MAFDYGATTHIANGHTHTIDFRSDTLTLPTPAMMEAIQNSPLGDAIYNEDPCTIKLENLAASMLGKENALLFPSGTMSNLVALWTHCPSRGCSAMIGDKSHIFEFEQGGIASVAGIFPKVIRNLNDGTLDMSQLEKNVPTSNPHRPQPSLICLENTHNVCGGKVIPMDHIHQVRKFADKHNFSLHLDGSRIFNAATKMGLPVDEIVKEFDSVNICLSKGLAAPIGSLLVGNKEFIDSAVRGRKIFGGAMRQQGVIAAPGIIALTEMTKRLQEDHDNAYLLAKGLSDLSKFGIQCDFEDVHTNIVIFRTTKVDRETLLNAISTPKEDFSSVKMMSFVDDLIRCVISYQTTQNDIQNALKRIEWELCKLC